MPGHSLNADLYRYSFQGQEKDGETGLLAFELRMYDPNLGRWQVPDPYGQYWSPYVGMGNNPVNVVDPDGGWGDGLQYEIDGVPVSQHEAEIYMNSGVGYRIGGQDGTINGLDETGGQVQRTRVDNPRYMNQSQDGNPIYLYGTNGESGYTNMLLGVAGETVILERELAAARDIEAYMQIMYDEYTVLYPGELLPLTRAANAWKIAGVTSFMLNFYGDNVNWVHKTDKDLYQKVLENSYEEFEKIVDDWDKIHPDNRIVFRYLTMGELANAANWGVLNNVDKNGNLVNKYVTPDFYFRSASAWAYLSLPVEPTIAVWTYEKEILASKLPPGPGVYEPVPADEERRQHGGGSQATIFQPFPIHGFFPLIR